MILKKTAIFIFLLFTIGYLRSQTDVEIINKANQSSDTNSLKEVLAIVQKQVDTNPDSALTLIEMAKPAFQNSTSTLLQAKIISRKALALVKTGKLDEAFDLANSSEILFRKLDYKKGIASSNNTKGMSKFYQGQFQEAQQYFINAEKMYLEIGLQQDALSAQQAQGAIFFQLGNLDMAEQIFLKAEQLAEEIHANSTALYIWTNLGSVYNLKNQPDKAIYYYTRVLDSAAVTQNVYLEMSAASNLGSLYWSMSKFDDAIKLENRALLLNDALGDQETRISILDNLASAWASKKNYSKANEYIDEAIDLINKTHSSNTDQTYKIKAQIKFAEGNSKEAYQWLEKHEHIKDSVSNASNQALISELQIEHNEYKNEQTIKNLSTEKMIKDSELKISKANTKIFIIISAAVLIILIVSIIALIKYAAQKRLLKKQNELIQESLREKEVLLQEVHHRVKNNLQMIYSILNLQSKDLSGDAAEVLSESRDRVKSISLIHEKLYKTEDLLQIDVGILLQEIAENVKKTSQFASNTQITTQCDNIKPEMDTLIALGIMVNELVTNCFKYACKSESQNQVNIQLKQSSNQVILKVSDNGLGFPANFDMNNPTSFGYKMLKTLCKKLKGEIICNNNNGADVTIVLGKFKMATA